MKKECQFCQYEGSNRKIPETACNHCRANKNYPFGSRFKEAHRRPLKYSFTSLSDYKRYLKKKERYCLVIKRE